MDARAAESGISSISSEEYDMIRECPCEEDSLRPSIPSSVPNSDENWDDPIIIYRKDKQNKGASSRCSAGCRGRVMKKNGSTLLIQSRVPLRYMRYMRDLGNTVVNSRWRWITLTLVLSFSILWLLFAWFWMLIAVAHGDLDDNRRTDPCTEGIQGFAGFLLMSIETQNLEDRDHCITCMMNGDNKMHFALRLKNNLSHWWPST